MHNTLDESAWLDCTHSFCRHHIVSLINAKFTEALCPVLSCRKKISVKNIREIVGKDGFDRLEERATKQLMKTEGFIKFKCPRCHVYAYIESSKTEHNCHTCRMDYCVKCRNLIHGDLPCTEGNPPIN
jgi:phage FluMu protein Com